MQKNWVTISEAVGLTKKSEPTIRRFVSEHKKDPKAVKKEIGKYYINIILLGKYYTIITPNQNTNQTTSHDTEAKHKKEAMQIAYNSEITKAKDEHIKAKDKQIELLIQNQNQKSFAWIWLTIGFVILIIALGIITYYLFTGYKAELINNQESKIIDISSNHQNEVKILKDQLIDTKKTYTVLIKEIKETNNKLTDSQSKTIDNKEKEIERLQKELDKINLKDSTDTDKT